MLARRPDLVGDASPHDIRLDRRALRLQRAADQAGFGPGVLAEADDARHIGLGGASLEPGELRIVAVDHRGAAGNEPEKDLGLGVRDLIDRLEEFEMHRRDGGDDRHVGPHQPGERRDLAGVVHADLENAVAGLLGQARERERHAPVIVERGDRGMDLAVAREREAERILGRGLADRAGDRDDLGAAAGPRRRRQV